jgi:hypothetical protein
MGNGHTGIESELSISRERNVKADALSRYLLLTDCDNTKTDRLVATLVASPPSERGEDKEVLLETVECGEWQRSDPDLKDTMYLETEELPTDDRRACELVLFTACDRVLYKVEPDKSL